MSRPQSYIVLAAHEQWLPEEERVFDPPLRFISRDRTGMFAAVGPGPDAPDDEVVAFADEWYRVWGDIADQELYDGWFGERVERDPALRRRVKKVARARMREAHVRAERADREQRERAVRAEAELLGLTIS